MSNKESENYLDQLLNSLSNGNSTPNNFKEKTADRSEPEESQEDSILREMDQRMGLSSVNSEEDFLREFEKEFDISEMDEDFLEIDDANVDFDLEEKEYLQPEQAISDVLKSLKDIEPEPLSDDDLSDFDEVAMDAGEPMISEDGNDVPPIEDEGARTSVMEETPLEETPLEEASLEEAPLEEAPLEEAPLEEAPLEETPLEEIPLEESLGEEPIMEELPLTEDGEGDLTGMKDEDLIDLLSSTDDLSEIGAMLNADGTMESIDGLDQIEDFAEQEMRAQENAVSGEEEESGKKKKGGFFKKLKEFFFGPDEDELDLAEGKGVDAATLSEENAQILAQLEGEENAEGGKKGKKEKKKKEKKEKPKKEPKPKKEKPKKEPKPKKEKPPKPVDKTPPLPKGPVIMIFLMAISLGVLIYLGGTLLSYTEDIKTAETLYKSSDYVGAYNVIAGTSVREEDETLYNRVLIMSGIQSKYISYTRYSEQKKETEALDSLICALGRCENYAKKAATYDCESEVEKIRQPIESELENKYHMSVEEVMTLYHSRTRKAYTLALQQKVKELGLE